LSRLLVVLAVALLAPTLAGAQSPTRMTVAVDAAGAVDPLIRFKIHQAHLEVLLDGEVVVDSTTRKAPDGSVVWQSDVAPGEHVIAVRWTVKFRSATDRHHPMGSAPEDVGFAVPEYDVASEAVTVEAGEHASVTARLVRKASVGVQGRSWVEWDVDRPVVPDAGEQHDE
jgi:hypothetical protein